MPKIDPLKVKVKMANGRYRKFAFWRVRHNEPGAFKGGIRFDPSAVSEEMEIRALAIWMTFVFYYGRNPQNII